MELFPIGKVYDFMGRRRLFAGLSLLLVVASMVVLVRPGPSLGTDFRGGTEIEVAFLADTQPAEIREAVTQAGFSSPDVVRVEDDANPHRFLIRVQEVSSIDDAQRSSIANALCHGDGAPAAECPAERRAVELKISPGGEKISVRFQQTPDLGWVRERMAAVGGLMLRKGEHNPSVQNERDHKVEILLESKGDQLLAALRTKLGEQRVPEAAMRVEWVGPKAGAQLRDAALKSIAVALIFVMMYIAFRFDLRFSPGAVLALAHDAIVTLGVLTLMREELNLTIVAAILTIVGYSVNDTVVVYDRVRENLGKLRGSTFPHIINVSLSEMLSRTVLTSGTTIFSLLAFFVWGTGTLKQFALTLIIGLVLGTYSSIYVALPLTEWLDRKLFSRGGGAAGRKRAAARKKEGAVV